MRVIAVTGGIGAGKSTVTGFYRELGVPVVDADAISRALTVPGGEALPLIREAFGGSVFRDDGTLDRAALAREVFADDPGPLARLNAILHPMILRRMRAELEEHRRAGEQAVIVDVPLLFEAGVDGVADAVLCVSAPEAVRIRRLKRRDGLTREQALGRIRRQNAPALTQRLSDYVLDTGMSFARTRRRALALWQRILRDGPRRGTAAPPDPAP